MSDRRGEANATTARGTFQIVNKLGMHARAATKLVQLASKFPCEVELSHGGQSANAKSVMGVLLLCGSKGSNLDVVATGEGADEAVQRIGELISGRFGEEE
jgi:phosphocarrier protein HPr